MTPSERRTLEDKRQQLELERISGMAKVNQAIGAIAMIDAMLALPHEVPSDQTQDNASQAA